MSDALRKLHEDILVLFNATASQGYARGLRVIPKTKHPFNFGPTKFLELHSLNLNSNVAFDKWSNFTGLYAPFKAIFRLYAEVEDRYKILSIRRNGKEGISIAEGLTHDETLEKIDTMLAQHTAACIKHPSLQERLHAQIQQGLARIL